MTKILRTSLASKFICVAEKCEDTCCKHWSMQVDDATIAKYSASALELLSFVEEDAACGHIMHKDVSTGCCVKLAGGRCSIQTQYGEVFLSDSCALYPRITRAVGDDIIITATMSCPEVARIALFSDNPLELGEAYNVRVPQEMKNSLRESLSTQDALAIHNIFLAAANEVGISIGQVFARINSVANSLRFIKPKDWPSAAPLYFQLADGRLPAPEANINDPFNLLHALCGLIVASKKPAQPRLQEIIEDIEVALSANLDWQNLQITTGEGSIAAYQGLQKIWQEKLQEKYSAVLKKWLAAQLSAAFFPFAGLGEDIAQRATIIGVRLAILRLAILSACSRKNDVLRQDDVVRIVQGLSRFLDHLSDPAFFLQICEEVGWNRESRMRGLFL